jgi:hypothetical protein
MVQITVSDELARQIAGASLPLVLVDSQGRELGQVAPLDSQITEGRWVPAERLKGLFDAPPPSGGQARISDEEWTEIQRRMANDDGTRYTWAEVREHLRSLAPE